MPNITIVSANLGHTRGGAEINDLHLGKEFEEMGHSVTYTYPVDAKRDPIQLDRPSRPVSCPYLYGVSTNFPDFIGKVLRHLGQEIFIHYLKNKKLELLQKSDLILTTGRPILSRISAVTPAPVFHAVRGSVNPLYHRHLKRADGLVFWGGCEDSYESLGDFETPYITLDPGVDTDIFYDYSESDDQSVENESDIPQLIFVGRLDPVKRVDRIIRAVKELSDKGMSVELTIIGEGSQRSELKNLAAELAIDERVHFKGRVSHENIPNYLNNSDIFILASEMENHPIALKEALACGTYAVAPDIGRIGEMMEKVDHGRLFDLDAGDSLSETLQKTITSECFTEEINSPTQIIGWRDNAEAILDMYYSVIDY